MYPSCSRGFENLEKMKSNLLTGLTAISPGTFGCFGRIATVADNGTAHLVLGIPLASQIYRCTAEDQKHPVCTRITELTHDAEHSPATQEGSE